MLKNTKLVRRFISVALLMAMLCSMVACTSTENLRSTNQEQKKKVVVTTSFLADMVSILTPEVEIIQIIPAGSDPHLYEASAGDRSKLQSGDLILYHGLHFEGKMVEILEKLGKSLSRNFPDDKVGHMEEDGSSVVDPHFWFDLDLYRLAVQTASEDLSHLLPEIKDKILEREEAYLMELKKLDEENKKMLDSVPVESRILVTPHDAFNYFAKHYSWKVVAPQGVSTAAESSVEDILVTVNTIVDNKIKAIFAETTTNPERMKKLQEEVSRKNWNVKVVSGEGKELFSDSLAPKGEEGDTFLTMYRHNVRLIVENLK